MRQRILVVEDDEDIIKLLKLYLENDGYDVITCTNGVDALEILKNMKIDLAVLDIMMPKMDGYELTKRIRQLSNLPVIILSAKNEISDKILGLSIGADDYMTKPFNPLEIIARIKSNLRRFYDLNKDEPAKEPSDKIIIGPIELDLTNFTAKKNGVELLLTPTEYRILHLLMKSPGRVYTKLQIYENIKGEYFESDDNTIMVHISKLRDKLEDNPKNPIFIKTVRGVGYKVEKK